MKGNLDVEVIMNLYEVEECGTWTVKPTACFRLFELLWKSVTVLSSLLQFCENTYVLMFVCKFGIMLTAAQLKRTRNVCGGSG